MKAQETREKAKEKFNYGLVYFEHGETDEAFEYMRDSASISEQAFILLKKEKDKEMQLISKLATDRARVISDLKAKNKTLKTEVERLKKPNLCSQCRKICKDDTLSYCNNFVKKEPEGI